MIVTIHTLNQINFHNLKRLQKPKQYCAFKVNFAELIQDPIATPMFTNIHFQRNVRCLWEYWQITIQFGIYQQSWVFLASSTPKITPVRNSLYHYGIVVENPPMFHKLGI